MGSSLFDKHYQFAKAKATHRLEKLAKNPFDLTDPKGMTPERLTKMVANGGGMRLLYGTQSVTEETMEELYALALEAQVFEKMEAQQAGEVMNFIEGQESEERPVLHTAVRDFFDSPNTSPKAQEATEAAKVEFKKLEAFIKKIDEEGSFTDMLFIGIGGSELGPKTLYYGLQGYQKPDRRVHFISNVDPDDTAQALRVVDLKRTLVVSVSKSGGTLETKTNEDLVRHHYREAGLDPQQYFIAATGQGSPMDDKGRFLECFYIWDWIGGRYCATSIIGGIAIAFACGFDAYRDLLKGANQMDKIACKRDLHENLPLLAALLGIWNRNFLDHPTLALIPYSQMLIRFAAHIQQVDMESNGKRIDRWGRPADCHTCPIVWGEPATNAQHSFFQMIHQGTDVVPLEFIGFRETQCGLDLEQNGTTSQEKLLANLFAQSLALAMGKKSPNPNKNFPGGRPSSILLARRLDPYVLGMIAALYEHKIDFQGYIWNINSFDQEGVQLGKVLANKVLDRIGARKGGEGGEPYPLGDTLLDQLDTL